MKPPAKQQLHSGLACGYLKLCLACKLHVNCSTLSSLEYSASPAAGLGVGISVHQTVITIHKVGELLGLPNTPYFRYGNDTDTMTL